MVEQQRGQQPDVSSSRKSSPGSPQWKRLTFLLVAGVACFALAGPAQSQLASRQVSPPEVAGHRTATTTPKIPPAPVQVAMPEPAPTRYVPGMEEALVATGPVTDQENKDLDAALETFHNAPVHAPAGSDFADYAKPLLAFVESHPQSNWNAALALNIGLGYYHAGYYSRTFDWWQKGWQAGRGASTPQSHLMVDRTVGELARMHARLGHAEELEALFKDMGKRPIGGPATELLQGAREGLWNFRHDPGIAYLCGPMALKNVMMTLKAPPKQIQVVLDARSGTQGVSLKELSALADKAGFKYVLIHRAPGQPIPVPSVMHLNVHHYAAVVATEGERYILLDPTFGGSSGTLVQAKAVDAESSGYFLVPASVVKAHPKAGWHVVAKGAKEIAGIYGMGSTTTNDLYETNCYSCTMNPSKNNNDSSNNLSTMNENAPVNRGMPKVNAHPMVVNLNLSDTPVGYQPQKGPSAFSIITYNQREAVQPATMGYSNIGPKWSLNWTAFIQDDPTSPSGIPRTMLQGGGGGFAYAVYPEQSGTYPELWHNTELFRIPSSGTATSYERRKPGSAKNVFAKFDGATTFPRHVFMTQMLDPQGNTLTINYDTTLRITSVVDAMGRSTTFTYGLTSYPLLITAITDPFGRSVQFFYDTSQRLSSVTDALGITTSFTYSTTETTFITSMTTPYGTSTFNDTPDASDPVVANTRSLTLTDPLGYTDFLYFYPNTTIVPASDPAAMVPTGMAPSAYNGLLNYRNTFYWDKHAFALGCTLSGGVVTSHDYTKAEIEHWTHYAYDVNQTGLIYESIKRPLENRVWYNYPGQSQTYYGGALNEPTSTARVLDDGTTQISKTTWNTFGNLLTGTVAGNQLTSTDAAGRTTQYAWSTDNQNLLTVQQLTASPSTYTTIATYGSYNTQHEPQTYTDAAGQTWNYTYNAAGQIATVKDPLLNVTTYNYDASNRLSSITNANGDTQVSYTYDSADRILTKTDSEGYVLTYAYDNLDRVTSITYPDGTTDLYDYTFQSGPNAGTSSLELRKHTDRLGRVTTYAYDADRRLTSVTEPTSGTATRTTSYDYYEDGTLKDIIDANGNDTHWAIDIQSRPVSKTYQYGTASATTETYAYENTISRLHSITDALGQVKTFSYNKDDTVAGITYTSSVNTTPNVTFAYDTYFPRLTSMVDGTGTTTYGYTAIGTAGALKLSTVTSPYTNGTIGLTYDNDGRLAARNIPGGNETFGYDAINRLNSHGTPLGSFTEGYLGQTNQIASQSVTNGTVTVSTGWGYDTNTNDRRLISIANSGVTRSYTLGYGSGPVNPYDIQSITDTAATGHPYATQSRNYTYDLIDRLLTASSTTPGNDTYAYDKLDNATTFNIPGTSTSPTYNGFNQIGTWGAKTYAYDVNGNLTSGDGVKTYKYDTENRLVEIDYVGTSNKSVFAYDGQNHRISDAETVSGTTTTTYYLWCGSTICQTRDSSQTVTRRDLPEGEYDVSTSQKLIYMPDQLGSVRDVIDATSGALVASYDFTPYGAVARSNVTNGTDYQYAGLFYHPASVLNLATFRALDGSTGRWTNRDPIKETGGPNLYAYAEANPSTDIDVLGLEVFADKIMGPLRRGDIWNSQLPNYPDAQLYTAPNGKQFIAPKDADWCDINASGQANGLSPSAIRANIGQGGAFDFQRIGGKHPEYIDASNYGVGVYMNGAGYGMGSTNMIGSGYSWLFSSNALDLKQRSWWDQGWSAANSNTLDCSCHAK